MFKKNDRSQTLNYRPVSTIPTLSKIYEILFLIQIYRFFNRIFSKYLCGFRKGHSTQHCLLYMLENLRKSLDKGLKTGVLLTDLSKVFDSISHDSIIAKLNAYGFCKDDLNLVNEQKLMIRSVPGATYCMVFRKGPFEVHYSLIFILTISFFSRKNLKLLADDWSMV